ncbi:MAG: hypothetical protein SXU28_14725, partial [Pseudomonadota bacterium]|nr:hypothetical protein [Pseudomonadota bacterium]
ESFQRTANLDTFREEDEVNRIEAEYGGVYAQAENEISRSGLRVYDILQAYEKEHADVLNKARS